MLKRREKTSHRQRQNNCSANNHQSLYLHTHRTPSSKQESKWKALSHVRLFVTPWTIQSMELSRPEYWSGYPFPSPGDLPNPVIEPRSPAFQVDSLPAEPQGKPKNTGVGSLSLLQQIFPTQELNWGLLNCKRILYQLSHKGSPRILDRVAYLFSRESSQPKNWTGVSCIAGRFFSNWAVKETLIPGSPD